MTTAPHFDISAAVVRQLGEELVSDEVTAIVELVKNAYDADANFANVVVNTKDSPPEGATKFSGAKGYITIDDDGFGMDEGDVRNGWLMISLSAKRKMKSAGKTTPKGRTPLGDKGLGRLSTQKLGHNLDLITRRDGSTETLHVSFSWASFGDERSLTDVPVAIDVEPAPGRPKGTQLLVSGLRNPDVWEGAAVDQLVTDLSQIISPYPEARTFLVTLKIDGRPIDLGHVSQKIRKAAVGRFFFTYKDQKLKMDGSVRLAKLRGNNSDNYDAYVSPDDGRAFFEFLRKKPAAAGLRLSKDKTQFVDFSYEVELGSLGDVDMVASPTEPGKRLPADPGPFTGEIDDFLLRGEEAVTKISGLTSATEIREIVRKQAGIKIFRDGFGIKPYGINGQDWLRLSAGWTSASSFYGLRPENVMGFILISEATNGLLKEKTDREGFVSNPWSQNFQRLVGHAAKTISDLYETIRRTLNLYFADIASRESPVVSSRQAVADATTVAARLSSYTAKGAALRSKSEVTRKRLGSVTERIAKAPIFASGAEREVSALLADAQAAMDASAGLFDEIDEYADQARGLAGIVATLAPRLEVLGEQLNDFSALAGLGLLAESLSHEVENQTDRLLQQTGSAAKKAQNTTPPNRDLLQFTRDVTSTVLVLRTLIAHLGPSLRYQRDRIEQLEISALLKEVRDHFKSRWEASKFECRMLLTGSDFNIEINRGRMIQVIDNLVLNSEYWLKEATKRDPEFKPEITIDYEPFRLRLWDNGPGIERSVEVALFEPFITLKPKAQGRGLGLFITSQIMESFGGSVVLLPDRNLSGNRYIFELDLTSIGRD